MPTLQYHLSRLHKYVLVLKNCDAAHGALRGIDIAESDPQVDA